MPRGRSKNTHAHTAQCTFGRVLSFLTDAFSFVETHTNTVTQTHGHASFHYSRYSKRRWNKITETVAVPATARMPFPHIHTHTHTHTRVCFALVFFVCVPVFITVPFSALPSSRFVAFVSLLSFPSVRRLVCPRAYVCVCVFSYISPVFLLPPAYP